MKIIVFAVAALLTAMVMAGPADAVVYCKRFGVPHGCVARPAAGVGAGAPGVGVTRGVGVGARGVGVAPGVGVNLGGPVNRLGIR